MNLKEEILIRNDTSIHFWTGGKSGAPLVVFTHGATVDHHEWDITLPRVGEHFQILTWDVRGHGSSRPAVFTLRAAVADLLALLDKLRVKQAIFLGHSMGGNLHQELAFAHPQLVKAMIFLDCTWNFQKLTALEKFSLKIAKPLFNLYPYQTLVNQALAAAALKITSQELLRPAVESLSKEELVQILMATAACLHYEPGYKIAKPLLLMVGEKDKTGNIRKIMPIWAGQEPDSRLVVIPRAGHAANLDNPEVFHETLMDFLLSRCQHKVIRQQPGNNSTPVVYPVNQPLCNTGDAV